VARLSVALSLSSYWPCFNLREVTGLGHGHICCFFAETDVCVAALEPGERGSFPWARWYSESAPSGEFRKVPGGYARFAINDAVASTMIDAIRAGRSLSDKLIEQLPICWGPESALYPSEHGCGRRGAR
jgi:hypothetical protein